MSASISKKSFLRLETYMPSLWNETPFTSGDFLCQGIWSIYPLPVANSFAKVFWILFRTLSRVLKLLRTVVPTSSLGGQHKQQIFRNVSI